VIGIRVLTVERWGNETFLESQKRTDSIEHPCSREAVAKLCAWNATWESIEGGSEDFADGRRFDGIPGRDCTTIEINAGNILRYQMGLSERDSEGAGVSRHVRECRNSQILGSTSLRVADKFAIDGGTTTPCMLVFL
jgi:hypothetical protein